MLTSQNSITSADETLREMLNIMTASTEFLDLNFFKLPFSFSGTFLRYCRQFANSQ